MTILEYAEIFGETEIKQTLNSCILENLQNLKLAVDNSIRLAKEYITTLDTKFLVFIELTEKEINILEPRIKRLSWQLKTLERKNETNSVDIEALKSGLDLREVAERYGIKFKNRNGKEWQACCPFHKDKNPSCSFSKRLYYCFSCGENGDVISLVQKLDNCNFQEAIKKLST